MRARRAARLCIAGVLLAGLPIASLADEPAASVAQSSTGGKEARVAEPAGFRMDDYRSATPKSLKGATTIDTAEAKRLFNARAAVFVDVLPRVPRPKGLPADTVWRPKPREDIPGSIWLVDTGYGELAPVMQRYFLDGLTQASIGDKSRPIVFYCLRDCWMSWNAAKRAVAAGYTSVHWYPDGTDGWAEAGLPLERREPETRPDE